MPLAWLKLLGRKVLLSLNWFEIPESYSIYYFKERYWPLTAAFLNYGLIAPLGLLGAVLCLLRRNLNLLHIFFFAYFVSLCAFYVTSRYRFPLVIPLIVFGAALLSEGIERIRLKSWSGIGPLLISFSILFGFCRWTPGWVRHYIIVPAMATPHTIAGYLHLQPSGDVQSAIKELETARAMNPGEPSIHGQLGAAYVRVGRLDEAVAALQEAIKRNGMFHEAHNNLAMLYHQRGDRSQALQAIERALEFKPDDATYRRNYQTIRSSPVQKTMSD